MTVCSVHGCCRRVTAKTLCMKHYQRLRKTGTTASELKQTDEERFMSFVDIDEATGAWLWDGGITGSGYGGFWLNGQTVLAHRFAYEMRHGPIPDGMFVCHKYEELGRHNVNPDHLFLGSHTDNMQDAADKHRTAHGGRNGQSKLTETDVAAIRSSSDTGAVLSRLYGVSEAKISQIKRGTAWQHTADAPEKPVEIHSLRNKSGYRGVCWKKGAWEAAITVTTKTSKKTIYLGRFQDVIEAAKTYDRAAVQYKGDKAKLNFPPA